MHLLPSLQHVFSEHFKWDPQFLVATPTWTAAAHSNWMSQGNLTGFVNKCCLLPGELLTLPTGSLSVLSITMSPRSFFPSSHSSFTLICFTHTLAVSHKSYTSFPLFLVSLRILMLSDAMNGKGLLCFCLSPTHLNTFCSSLSSLCLSACGLVRLLCSVGRASESDLTSAVLLLSWLLCLTLMASSCESYVKIWCHYCLSKLGRSLWNQAGVCARVLFCACTLKTRWQFAGWRQSSLFSIYRVVNILLNKAT